jgi:hypothetical protein
VTVRIITVREDGKITVMMITAAITDIAKYLGASPAVASTNVGWPDSQCMRM